jgi:hypothetical protein
MDDGLWTNRSSRSDFGRNAFAQLSQNSTAISIATAFFTEKDVVESMANNDCDVMLVVRLGFPTNPAKLRALLSNDRVQMRYFTSDSFHPKLYIFDQRVALVGSANLTSAAINSNQEILVSITSADPRFGELSALFAEYWNEAQVLTETILDKYDSIFQKYKNINHEISNCDDDVSELLDEVRFNNISTGQKKKSKELIFLETYSKTYQESVAAFNKISDVYLSNGLRKSEKVPLRLEIDSFFSFVRETYATTDSWEATEIGWTDSSRKMLNSHIQEWHKISWPHFENTICSKHYPLINEIFSSVDSISGQSLDSIIETLCVLHSFHDRLRFFKGGLESLKDAFRQKNDIEKVRSSLSHLLFGNQDVETRMADLIYDAHYKLEEFGESAVQELIGWVGSDDLPVLNARTTKILRYYGFQVRQI